MYISCGKHIVSTAMLIGVSISISGNPMHVAQQLQDIGWETVSQTMLTIAVTLPVVAGYIGVSRQPPQKHLVKNVEHPVIDRLKMTMSITVFFMFPPLRYLGIVFTDCSGRVLERRELLPVSLHRPLVGYPFRSGPVHIAFCHRT